MRILIVEDEKKMAELLKKGLEEENHSVTLAHDGRIVAFCRQGKVRQIIAILDLPLPTPAPVGAEWITAYHHWRKGF